MMAAIRHRSAGSAESLGLGRRARDAGVTLVELLITMTLLGVVSSLVVVGVQQSVRVLTRNDDENRGLQDAKIILDRLARDIRQARGVVCDGAGGDTYCRQHLQLWIDTDSDYVKDPTEIITWKLENNPDGEHFDVWRVQGVAPATPTQRRQASALIVKTLFSYDVGENVDPSPATLVTLKMEYDAIVGRGTDIKQASVSVRLRNKG
jgi:prepilin-type N-terminal cleavage/methylation domain-containing protein